MNSYYGSNFSSGGVSYYSSDYGLGSGSSRYSYLSGSTSPTRSFYSRTRYGTTRNRFAPGSHRLERNELFFKYRHYAPNDNSMKSDGSRVLNLDLNKTANRTMHHTDKYGDASLIVRRGQEFSVDLEIKVPFEKERDVIQFLFSKGKTPLETQGTMVRINVCNDKKEADSSGSPTDWKAYISSINGQSVGAMVSIVILPSATALIGKYTIRSKVYGRNLAEEGRRYIKEEKDEQLIVLFNAWCKDDQVYMEQEEKRNEYVMNETGRIWVGSAGRNYGRPWAFSQFSKHCLGAALYLLDESYLNDKSHANATLVSRALSAMANSSDYDKGVLSGNWSGNYAGGTSPTAWNGSSEILKQYMMTKRDVKYGQCWVFSGLLTTLGRTIGIPSRSVTNFESAHDSDNSLSIDTHYNFNYEPIKEMNHDSVWNFHVWNEAWFKRPDLPDGYDGWQAFDATPQESSEGMMRCGPAPLKAIKEGNVYLSYDGRFIFAEVNGDKVTWLVSDNDMIPIRVKPAAVGKEISTKAVGGPTRHDITDEYKYPEGSEQERKAVARASKFSSKKEDLDELYRKQSTSKDVTFKYESPVSRNGDIHIKITATNTSKEERNVTIKMATCAVYYTGVVGMDIDSQGTVMKLQAGESQSYGFDLESKEYLNMIDEDAKIKEFVTCCVQETNQFFQEEEIFHVEKPELKMTASQKNPKVKEKIEVTMTFENPLDLTLTNGKFVIEGPGIQTSKIIHLGRNIKPRELVTQKTTLTPKYAGKREVIACFNSRQLVDIVGALEIEVEQTSTK